MKYINEKLMKQVRNVNLAKDQLKRHADVLQAETLALERRIAFANEELARKQ